MAEESYEIPEVPGLPACWPAFDTWPELVESNRALARSWGFSVAGRSYADIRRLARTEVLDLARAWSEFAGIAGSIPGDPEAAIVMTGHQPEIYHCGVWIKQFAMQRLADDAGASAVNIVVDSDAFDDVGFSLPCRRGGVARCYHILVEGGRDTCYSCSPPPALQRIEEMDAGAGEDARHFSEEVSERFEEFVSDLRASSPSSANLAEALTKARRLHEGPRSHYLELPISVLVRGSAFQWFVADLILNAERFVHSHNAELRAYRAERRLRSDAQPFPDLGQEGGRLELPLWALTSERRPVWVEKRVDGAILYAGDDVLAELPSDPAGVVSVLAELDAAIAPKALALTAFMRTFACDLLIHGVGGARYDAVTDRVCRAYYGVVPAAFATISLSMHIAGEPAEIGEQDISALRARMNRLEHNPDEILGELELAAPEKEHALSLAAEKARLVGLISAPDADKKALGARIRSLNGEIGVIVAPYREALGTKLAALERMLAESQVLRDRGYPYFLWSADEVAATLK